MKSKNISVLVLSITLILVSLIFVSSFGLSKPKPNPKPEQNSELITFTGDLVGDQEVEGCCPNAGPNPEYNMTLSEVFPWSEMHGPHDGQLFMNSFGGKLSLKWAYKVQFWWGEGGDGYFYEYFIEIRGGDIERDRKTKILTVTFENVPCYEIWKRGELLTKKVEVNVTFTLTRDPHHPANK